MLKHPESSQLTIFQTRAPVPNASARVKHVDYPWLYGPAGGNHPWKDREDQYLIDAMVRGESYFDISKHLSRGLIQRSEAECRKRVEFHTTWQNGGHLLPKQWDWTDRQVFRHRVDHHRTDSSLTLDEFEEILLFKGRGMRGLNPGVFRDQRSAIRLRKEVEKLDSLDPRLFQTAVNVLQKRRKESNKEGRGRPRPIKGPYIGHNIGAVSNKAQKEFERQVVSGVRGGLSFKEIKECYGFCESVPKIELAYHRGMQKIQTGGVDQATPHQAGREL